MPTILTPDPIMTILQAKEIGGYNDEETAIRLINIVSDKFLIYTNRVAINEQSIVEQVMALDGNAAFTHATPISPVGLVVVEKMRDGTEETFTEADGDLIVDSSWGRIIKIGDCWQIGQGFRNLELRYTGGWATVPAGVQAGALAQMKIEQQRIKGLVGTDSYSAGGDTTSPDRDTLIEECLKAWKPYRIMA